MAPNDLTSIPVGEYARSAHFAGKSVMDLQLLIITLAGLITTLIGAIVGPHLLDRDRRRLDRQLRSQTARERPYVDFARAVERTQLDLDLMASGDEVDHDEYLEHFRAMEEARSVLDLVGTQSVRVWAYRCRIAITSMNRDFQTPVRRNHYRTKLHEARAAFVTYARAEVGLVIETLPTPVDAMEDSAAGHTRWLECEVDILDVKYAVAIASAEFGEWAQPLEKRPGHNRN